MRDKLKNKEYFNLFISKRSESIERMEKKLSDIDKSEMKIIENIKYDNFKDSVENLLAKYSRGDDIETIREDIINSLSMFEECYKGTNYAVFLRYISLVSLLNLDKEFNVRIQDTLKKYDINDAYYNFLLSGTFEGRDWKYIEPYKNVILAEPEERVEMVKKLLSKWYVSHQSSYWYGLHKRLDEDLYFGYWAVDIAALVKILNIPDDIFKNNKYYPYDLVHFGG